MYREDRTMAITLSRAAFVEYRCFGMPDEYPKSTEQAVTELRIGDYDASVPAMNYVIKQGKVSPARSGRNYEWQPEHIDQAASLFGEQEPIPLSALGSPTGQEC
jgi:hypothetical protein